MNLSQFLLFEERLRQTATVSALQLTIVNLMQTVFPYYQAILFQDDGGKVKTLVASNVSQIDEHAQAVVWLNNVFLPWLSKYHDKTEFIPAAEFLTEIDENYKSLAGVIYIPIKPMGQKKFGVIFWVEQVPTEDYFNAFPLITSAINHAWGKLLLKPQQKKFKPRMWWRKRKNVVLITLGVLILLSFLRVHQYVLVNAEISPKKPILISPSISGTIHTINVEPNALVKSGQLLFTLDDITVQNKYEEATEQLNVAQDKYLKAYRHAFSDTDSLYEISMLKGDVDQNLVTQQYYKSLLARTQVIAPKPGVILYSDPKNWLGKPVVVGEKVMLLAQPTQQEVNFWIPVDSILDVDLTVPVRFFPNENPTVTVYAKLAYVNPIAEAQPDNTLSYFGVAELTDKTQLKLGQKGILKVYGKKVSLFHYVTSKPLRYIRQHLGI